MKLVLTVTQGPQKGRRFEYAEHETLLVGRSPEAGLGLPDDRFASRTHCMLEVNPPRATVRDLGSLNGSYLNGVKFGGRREGTAPIAPGAGRAGGPAAPGGAEDDFERELAPGDELRIGDTVLSVSAESDAACSSCGRAIPWQEEDASAAGGGSYRCAACREKAAAAEKARIEAERQAAERAKARPPAAPASPSPAGGGGEAQLMRMLMELMKGGSPQRIPTFPGYEVLRRLGGGGMGDVYLAKDRSGEPRVIKIIKPDHQATDKEIRRFKEREIPISLAMDHPNAVRYYEGDFSDGVYYLVMEYVEGSDAQKLLEEAGRVAPELARSIMVDALDGMEYIHRRGVVHRDIKPPNILLSKGRGGWIPKIADFGLSKDKKNSNSMTRPGEIAGSLAFIAPDQIVDFRNSGPAVDIFSMGATLYTMISGDFVNDYPKGKDAMLVRVQDPIVPIERRMPGLPRRLAQAIDKAVAYKPKDRFASCAEFREALIAAK